MRVQKASWHDAEILRICTSSTLSFQAAMHAAPSLIEPKITKKIFFFDAMLTPKIITFVYWLGLLAVLVAGVGQLFGPYTSVLSGLGILVGGAIGVRIWCELLIVLFKINDNLQKIANRE
jgi:hypothetical protein